MKNKIAAGFIFFSFMFPLSATAASFKQIYVFGDSLSDTGNSFRATGIFPFPYSEGKSSNGKLWVEYLAEDLQANLTNFAFSGATTGTANTLIPDNILAILPPDSPLRNLPGLQQEIASYKATNIFDPSALYIVWAGANDYAGGRVTNPNLPVNNLSQAITSLYDTGARNFLVANLPNLGQIPATRNTTLAGALNDLTQGHNIGLAQSLNFLNQKSDINISLLDVNSLFTRAQAGEFGFTNVEESCLTGDLRLGNVQVCDNPNDYVFWDARHPTTRVHEIIAKSALSQIEPASVPEPSATVGMLALGVGAGSLLKRKQKTASAEKVEV